MVTMGVVREACGIVGVGVAYQEWIKGSDVYDYDGS